MNPIAKEGRRQKVEHFKKQALLALTTAFRAPLMLMMGCGTTVSGINIHDHNGKKMAEVNLGILSPTVSVPYIQERHEQLKYFVEVGDEGPWVDKDGHKSFHRHPPQDKPLGYSIGAVEYYFE